MNTNKNNENEKVTCTICGITSRKGYHFDSHLASDEHRFKALLASHYELLQALKASKKELCDSFAFFEIESLEQANKAIETAEEVQRNIPYIRFSVLD